MFECSFVHVSGIDLLATAPDVPGSYRSAVARAAGEILRVDGRYNQTDRHTGIQMRAVDSQRNDDAATHSKQ